MNNFARAHNSYLEPPDDDPICEGEHGCGDYLERDRWTGEWICVNKFCPTKFDGVAQEMAEALVEYMEEIRTLKARLTSAKLELDILRK